MTRIPNNPQGINGKGGTHSRKPISLKLPLDLDRQLRSDDVPISATVVAALRAYYAAESLEDLKAQVLQKFQKEEKLGRQSSAYKKANKVLDIFIQEMNGNA